MNYLETTIQAERVALLEGERRGDVISWLTGSNVGFIEREWDENDD